MSSRELHKLSTSFLTLGRCRGHSRTGCFWFSACLTLVLTHRAHLCRVEMQPALTGEQKVHTAAPGDAETKDLSQSLSTQNFRAQTDLERTSSYHSTHFPSGTSHFHPNQGCMWCPIWSQKSENLSSAECAGPPVLRTHIHCFPRTGSQKI